MKPEKQQQTDGTSQMTPEILAAFAAAWSRGDVDKLMSFITDDCVYSASVGPEPGTTYTGREAVRQGFENMLKYDAGRQSRGGPVFIVGNKGAAEWSYHFTDETGRQVEIKGCDLFEFAGNKIRRKDAYRKTVA